MDSVDSDQYVTAALIFNFAKRN